MSVANVAMPRSWMPRSEALSKLLEVSAASNNAPPVNVSSLNHAVITLALHRSAYSAKIRCAAPLVFLDGSKPIPFPLGGLGSVAQSAKPAIRLAIGLMSFRHPEMDFLVDYYVTRNRELALLSTMADEEQLAHDRAIEFLTDSALDNGGEIVVYHTGLEPMVVGFYRAVVEAIRARRAKGVTAPLQVCSHFFASKPTTSLLTPESPGAKHENYVVGPCWA